MRAVLQKSTTGTRTKFGILKPHGGKINLLTGLVGLVLLQHMEHLCAMMVFMECMYLDRFGFQTIPSLTVLDSITGTSE